MNRNHPRCENLLEGAINNPLSIGEFLPAEGDNIHKKTRVNAENCSQKEQ
jgi:hypothetical protein